jgi:hypothetical protein
MKTNKQKVKTTYTREQLHVLLLKEAFRRDLPLFVELVTKRKEGLFDSSPMIPPGTTFTAVSEDGETELFVNLPVPKK